METKSEQFERKHEDSCPKLLPLSPLELVLLVPDVVSLIVVEELGDARRQIAVDAVHVAGRGHDGTHVFVTVLDTLLHLKTTNIH